MANIHATAVVDPSAKLGTKVEIGPFCVIGPDVELGDGVVVRSHALITGRTTLGAECRVFPFASLGEAPQDVKYHGEPSTLTIGAKTVIREHVTINPGTEGGHMATKVGSNCLLMIGSHVAHDCELGDNVTLVNGATLGGHVSIGDGAIIGGLSAVLLVTGDGRVPAEGLIGIGAFALLGGPNLMSPLPFIVLLNVLILMPIALLAIFAVLYTAIGTLAFGSLLEEA